MATKGFVPDELDLESAVAAPKDPKAAKAEAPPAEAKEAAAPKAKAEKAPKAKATKAAKAPAAKAKAAKAAKPEKKAAAKKGAAKAGNGSGTRKVGVIDSIIALCAKGATKDQVCHGLIKKFPDRDAEGMRLTVNTQLGGRLKARGCKIVRTGKGGESVYTVTAPKGKEA